MATTIWIDGQPYEADSDGYIWIDGQPVQYDEAEASGSTTVPQTLMAREHY